jgi:hypothetical protein
MRALDQDEAMTSKALNSAHWQSRRLQKAVAALHQDTQEGWEGTISADPADLDEDEEPVTPDAAGLLRFLEHEVLPWYMQRRKEL